MRLATFMLDLLHPTPPLGGSLIKANKNRMISILSNRYHTVFYCDLNISSCFFSSVKIHYAVNQKTYGCDIEKNGNGC